MIGISLERFMGIRMLQTDKIKAVLWDLDDTLYSRVNAARQNLPGMLKTLLYTEKSERQIEEMADFMMTKVHRNSMVPLEAFEALVEKYPPDKPFDYAACLNYYYENMCKFAKPFPEQLSIVKKLRQMGIKTAIVTNISQARAADQWRKIRMLGIEELFNAIVVSGELGIHKPDRRIFDHAAKLLGVFNDQCLFVGDDPASDVMGARNADMEVVWIDRWNDGNPFEGDPRVHRVQSVLEYFA